MTASTKASIPAAAQEAMPDRGVAGNAPIIVDMGKKSRKEIRKLRKGKSGRLMNRVDDTIEHLKANGAMAEGAQVIVIVVQQKTKRRGKQVAKMWGLG